MIRIFKELSKKEVILILCTILLVVLEVWLELKIPEYMGKITEIIETEWTQLKAIFHQWQFMLLFVLWSAFVATGLAFVSSKVASNFAAKLRLTIYEKVQSFSMENVKNFSIASLITRETNDVTQVQNMLVDWLQMFTKAPIIGIWALIKILQKDIIWSSAPWVAILLLLILASVLLIVVIPKFKLTQQQVDAVNNSAREHINGIKVIRAFNAEKFQESKFDEKNSDLMKTNLFTSKAISLMMPCVDLIMHLLTLAIYFIWAIIISRSAMPDRIWHFSDMMVFSSYTTQLIVATVMLVFVFFLIPWATVSARRIAEVLDTNPSIKDWDKKANSRIKWKVEFKNVSFKYPDAEEAIIENISFIANPWETIAFIGPTWSWKSTIINLIPRFYDATEWEILIDWMNIKDYKQKDLRNKIWYIAQKAFLFKWNIKNNILFWMKKSERNTDNLNLWAKVSESKEFISRQKDWYDAYVALGWNNFSWWQKQRLSIARAIARNPEILIFDDSFSALDYKTDLKVRNHLKKYLKETTVFIVAQRIWTIKRADKILVIDQWKCVWMWTHEELLNTCETYKEIALSQLSEDELKI